MVFFYPHLLVPHLVLNDIYIFCWKCYVCCRHAQQRILRMNVLILCSWMLSVTHHETAVSSLPRSLIPLGRHATVITFMFPKCILHVQINGTRTVPSFNLPIPKQDLRRLLLHFLHGKSASEGQTVVHILLRIYLLR